MFSMLAIHLSTSCGTQQYSLLATNAHKRHSTYANNLPRHLSISCLTMLCVHRIDVQFAQHQCAEVYAAAARLTSVENVARLVVVSGERFERRTAKTLLHSSSNSSSSIHNSATQHNTFHLANISVYHPHPRTSTEVRQIRVAMFSAPVSPRSSEGDCAYIHCIRIRICIWMEELCI